MKILIIIVLMSFLFLVRSIQGAERNPYSLYAALNFDNHTHLSSEDSPYTMDFMAYHTFSFGKKWSITPSVSWSKEFKDEEELAFLDPVVSGAYQFDPIKSVKSGLALKLYFPLSKDAREKKILGVARLSFPVSLSIPVRYISSIGLSLRQDAYLYLYEFQTGPTGRPNNKYRYAVRPSLSVFMLSNLSLDLEMAYSRSFKYVGASNESVEYEQRLNFSFYGQVIGIAHNNSHKLLESNGRELDFSATEGRNSVFYLYATLSI